MTAFGEGLASIKRGDVAIIGVPLDENSSFLRGAALAPPRIREALRSRSSNMFTELGIDLAAGMGWTDLGDLVLPAGQGAFEKIEASISSVLARGSRVLALGGDHSITYPILKAFGKNHRPLTILQIDAHPDTYDEYQGNRYSHACPFARIMEEGLAARLVQVGVRSLTQCQRQQNERFGITAIEMKDWAPERIPELEQPVYLSLDLDGLDPAFAPGVSHHEPGGLTTRDVLRIIHSLPPQLIGADIVEFNPNRDIVGVTAVVAAKFCKELLGRMISATPAQKP
ncbi:MAG: agmatinase [Thermoplasmata archaeon]